MKNVFGKILILALAVSAGLASRAQAGVKATTYDLGATWLAGELDFLCPDSDQVQGCDKEIFYCHVTVEERLLDHLNNPANCQSVGNEEWACDASQLAAVNSYAAGLQSLTEVGNAETCAAKQPTGSPNFDKNADDATLQEIENHFCHSSAKEVPASCQSELSLCQSSVATLYSSQLKLARDTGKCIPSGDNLACQGKILKVIVSDLGEHNTKQAFNSGLESCEAGIALVGKWLPAHAALANDGNQGGADPFPSDASEGSKDTVPSAQGNGAQPQIMLAGSGCTLTGGSETSLDPAWIFLACSASAMALRLRRKR